MTVISIVPLPRILPSTGLLERKNPVSTCKCFLRGHVPSGDRMHASHQVIKTESITGHELTEHAGILIGKEIPVECDFMGRKTGYFLIGKHPAKSLSLNQLFEKRQDTVAVSPLESIIGSVSALLYGFHRRTCARTGTEHVHAHAIAIITQAGYGLHIFNTAILP